MGGVDQDAGGAGGRALRRMPAPELRETADIWFDSGADPVITWDPTGRRFTLVDGAADAVDDQEGEEGLLLLDLPAAVPDADLSDIAAADIALVLRDGLAACDFPPTADGVSPARAIATLRAGGLLR
jgi:hypothetical protein